MAASVVEKQVSSKTYPPDGHCSLGWFVVNKEERVPTSSFAGSPPLQQITRNGSDKSLPSFSMRTTGTIAHI